MARAGIPVVNHRFIPAEDKSLAAADACCIDTLTVLLQLGAVFTLLPPEQQTLWGLFVERFSCGRNFLLLLITLMMPPLISRPPFKQPISSVITHRSATYRFRKDTLSCLFGFLLHLRIFFFKPFTSVPLLPILPFWPPTAGRAPVSVVSWVFHVNESAPGVFDYADSNCFFSS